MPKRPKGKASLNGTILAYFKGPTTTPTSSPDSPPPSSDSEPEEKERKKRKKNQAVSESLNPRRSVRTRGSVSYKQDRSPSSSSRSPSPALPKTKKTAKLPKKKEIVKPKNKTIDARTREFLNSGPPEAVIARSKKVRENEEENGIEVIDDDDEDFAPNKRRRGKRARRSIVSYFKDESSSSESSCPPSPKKELKKVLDPLTKAFLASGIPEVVMKAQKVVEKKQIEDEYLSLVGYFPKTQSTELLESFISNGDALVLPEIFKILQKEISIYIDWKIQASSILSTFISKKDHSSFITSNYRHRICCRSIENVSVGDDEIGMPSLQSETALPWIEECKVDGLKNLACDKEAVKKLTVWLKQWKTDIKDDGGTSRKIEVKKKRRGSSESDFIESDEDEGELKKKSVLLIGPPGCGKTVAVHVAAKHFGFHVVEVNFSSRRPGKDVLQRVEEAVLSHRLKSSHNCLLLFEDIDLIDSKEDEGFHPAVAQLITTAMRPIVMTSSCMGQLSLDPKLEKKSPLVIQFDYPKPAYVIRKVLLPLIQSRFSFQASADDEEEDYELKKISQKLSKLLDSTSRHGRNDIRQMINQLQFLFSFTKLFSSVNPISIHQHGIQNNSLVDLTYQRCANTENDNSQDDCDENELRLTSKGRKNKLLKKLDSVSELMTFICDLDIIDSIATLEFKNQYNGEEDRELQIKNLKHNYFDPNFCQSYDINCNNGVEESLLQSLIIESDLQEQNNSKGYKLIGEIGEYCDGNIWADGGWETASCVRSIIKMNMKDSVGRLAKRNGRVTSYFNRLDRQFTSRICNSFGFDKELDTVK